MCVVWGCSALPHVLQKRKTQNEGRGVCVWIYEGIGRLTKKNETVVSRRGAGKKPAN